MMLILSLSGALTSCLDDTFDDFDTTIGDGIGELSAAVTFMDPVPALHSRAGGDAVNSVTGLWVILYHINDSGQSTYYGMHHVSNGTGYNYTINQDGNSAEPDDKENNVNMGATGETTPRATFRIPSLPYGKYKIYAVANVPGLTQTDVETEDKLKSMEFEWNTDVAQNNAMFGYFTYGNESKSRGFDAPTLFVNKSVTELHAWAKRLVSKVTVAIDPSGLKEAVWVYIKSITVHDIPTHCRLGKENSPGTADSLITNGESIKYYTEATADNAQHEQWGIILNKTSGTKGSDHSNDAEALYFFENLQGDYSNDPNKKLYQKPQIKEETGKPIDAPVVDENGNVIDSDYKDRVPYGTYIEVVGYYRSQNKDRLTSGPIKYRFMLGKDILYNYDAERNYHYKLTLKLKGFANEADWHISYIENTPSLFTPDQYYISYLYGQDLNFPVRVVTGDDNVKKYKVKAQIIENNWAPYEAGATGHPAQSVGSWTDINGFGWNENALNNIYKNDIAFGFLSLRLPVREAELPFRDDEYGPDADEDVREYYTQCNAARAVYSLSQEGTFNIDGKSADGAYTVKHEEDKSVTLQIPMYTRQYKIVAKADFSGNNPFPWYQRKAVVRFTLYDENGKQIDFKDEETDKFISHKDVPIYQVHRVVNPKAIYRAHDNDEKFDVTLMRLVAADATTFTPFESEGPWRVSILEDPNGLITLTGKDGTKVTEKGKYIEGSTGSHIEFTYKPSGTIGANETRCGIIKVEYHDYTCNHLIFVRQGYHKGVQLGTAKWSCYQVYATGKSTNGSDPSTSNEVNVAVTQNPLSIGSFYKRIQYNYGIRDKNNAGSWLKIPSSLSVTYLNGTEYSNATTPATKNKAWGDFSGYGWTSFNGGYERHTREWADTWTTVGGYYDGQKLTVPTAAQYKSVLDNCDFGFGVAYADGATATATTKAEAYGYTDYDNNNNGGVGSSKGMRVCVAYNLDNGDNVIFPIGAEGQGRRARKLYPGQDHNMSTPSLGALSYSGMWGVVVNNRNDHRPLTYNIYRHPGALYWVKKPVLKSDGSYDYASWDIGYFTFVFNHFDESSLGVGSKDSKGNALMGAKDASDAIPIKLVYKQ